MLGKIPNKGILATSIADGTVTTNKIVALAVTLGKLALDIFNTLTNVTFDKGADQVVIIDASDSGRTKKAYLPTSKMCDIDAAVAANALTITINPVTLDFRSTTLTDGTPVTITLASAATVVVPNTATLGTVNASSARLAVIAINNAGTIEAAVVNLAGGNLLDETNLLTTTAVSTASDSANVVYSTSARSNVAYRVVGFIDITEASAGVWATAPTVVQPIGGQALAAYASIGYGQSWQSVTRNGGTTYYNTTGKPITLIIHLNQSGNYGIAINGVDLNASGNITTPASCRVACSYIIPPGHSYVITIVASSIFAHELR
jgi:hypothetical protein